MGTPEKRGCVISSVAVALLIAAPAASSKTINGTNVGETLTGTANSDVIFGYGGNDRLRGEGGNDRLNGGAGRDFFNGGSGGDRFEVDMGERRCSGSRCAADEVWRYRKAEGDCIKPSGSFGKLGLLKSKGSRDMYLLFNVTTVTIGGQAAMRWDGQVWLTDAGNPDSFTVNNIKICS